MNRKLVLTLISLLLIASFVLSACGGGAATPAPAAPAAEPTKAPVAEPTKAPEQPAAAPEPTKAPEPAVPASKYNEAPDLAELVKAGTLPKVEDRLPEEPYVIQAETVGQYGGVWRRGFTGPGDYNNYTRVVYDGLVIFSTDGTEVQPKIALGWENSDDYSTWTIKLRKGAKWSDGEPFTADAITWWYENVLLNKDITPSVGKWMRNQDGTVAKVEKVDDYAVKFTFSNPNTLFLYELANQDGGDRTYAPFMPGHYLKQFHPAFTPQADIDKVVAEAGFKTWIELFASKNAPSENPDRPTMTAWHAATRISEKIFSLKRNPYYIGVDQAGNQLPYIDEVRFTFFENAQALNLAAIAGELDQQDRHINLMNYPVLKENETKGLYRVASYPTFGGTDASVIFNMSYIKDPELVKLIQNRDFRLALNYAVDRNQIIESAFMGLGEARAAVPAPNHPYYPGDEVAHPAYLEYKPDEANALLDKIGLDKKNAEGFRLYPGTDKPVIVELAVVAAFGPWPDVATLVSQNWEAVGIKTLVQVRERALEFQLRASNDVITEIWNQDTSGFPFTGAPKYDPRAALHWWAGYATWYSTDGKEGVEPTAEVKKMVDIINNARTAQPDQQVTMAKELFTTWVDQAFEVPIVGLTPMVQGVAVINPKLKNIPEKMGNDWPLRTPGNGHPETWYYEK